MISLDTLKDKQAFYKNKLSELMNTNIDQEVDKRLVAMREEISKQVIADIDKDATACKHYLEILNALIESDVEEAPTQAEVESTNVESDVYTNDIME